MSVYYNLFWNESDVIQSERLNKELRVDSFVVFKWRAYQ